MAAPVQASSSHMRRQARRLAHAIRHGAERVVERKGRQVFEGQVTAVDPFRCTLLGADLTLDEDDVTFSQDVERYDASEGINEGDMLALIHVREGEWLAVGVLSDTTVFPVPEPTP